MLSVPTLITLYICVTNPLIPITIYKIGKYTFLKCIPAKKTPEIELSYLTDNKPKPKKIIKFTPEYTYKNY